MANSIVGGLFGIDPTQYQQQQNALANQQAMQFAEMDPFQRANYGMFRGGQQLGQAASGLMGIQDPQLQKASMAKQLASQFDLTTAEGMKQYAQALAQNGAMDLAQMAVARSQEMEAKGLNIEKTRMEVSDLANFRKEVAALGPQPSEEELIALAAKYGGPDKVIAALSAKGSRDQALALRQAELTRKIEKDTEKTSAAAQAQQDTLIGVRDSALEGKALVDNIRKQVGYNTTGVGAILAYIPQTEARQFKSDVDTLKSQLTLATMNLAKSQSRTGATGFGALNKEELKVLQTNIANLDTGLSPADFNKKLDSIYKYFDKLDVKSSEKLGLPTEQQPQQPTEARKPKTRKLKSGLVVTEEE